MDKRSQKLVLRIEQAGLRHARLTGQLPTRDELLSQRIQVLPLAWRLLLGLLCLSASALAWIAFEAGRQVEGIAWVGGALLLGLFAVFGLRRTVKKLLESLDAVSSAEILEGALSGLADLAGSALDGF